MSFKIIVDETSLDERLGADAVVGGLSAREELLSTVDWKWLVVPVMFTTDPTELVDNILLECNVCRVWEREPNEDVEFKSKDELRSTRIDVTKSG